MLIKLIRNKPCGSAITGRLVINGRYFCNTLERVGYQIPALCYPVKVTMSPKFKRLLPLVCDVPQSRSSGVPLNSSSAAPKPSEPLNSSSAAPEPLNSSPLRSGIRFHRGTKPTHSTGCILVVADNYPMPLHSTPYTIHPPRGRTSADVEQELTNLLKQVQSNHEEIILEVIDFRPGTEYGYNTPCPSELQKRCARHRGQSSLITRSSSINGHSSLITHSL